MAKVNITQVRSRIGATATQCKNLDALGLRRMGRTVQHEATATILGMIERVKHLVKIEMNAAEIEKKRPVAVKKAAVVEGEAPAKKAPAEKKAPVKKAAATKKPAAPKAAAEKKAAAPKKSAVKKEEE